MARRRIGILGGTFDPPHEGHLLMAREALDRLELQEVLFVPVLSPSHKSEAVAPFADRIAMVRLLIEGQPRLRVSDLESRLGKKSYTVPMLEALRRELGEDALLFFLIGADSLVQFHLWFRYQEILRLVTVVVFSRPGFALENPNLTAAEMSGLILLSDLHCDLASRAYRERHAGPLPEAVRRYVEERGLYRTPNRSP